jgi:glycosyltransferase involved in cell wall biosynthesis
MAAWVAWVAERYSVIVSVSEGEGIPLGAAMRAMGHRTPHVVIGHRLSSRLQRHTWRLTGIQHTFDAVVCVGRAQADYANSPSGMGIRSAHFVYDKVDEHFFRPLGFQEDGYILAVGQEQRDYATLVRAATAAGKPLVVVASSPWATCKIVPQEAAAVKVLSRISAVRLRELYARARVVVVPVNDVDYAAGVNGLLEGMAMGRPVVSSRTSGLAGYVEDGITGLLVPPTDPGALRAVIERIWDDPGRRASLGDAGRAAVEANMGFDRYVGRVAQIATDVQTAGTLDHAG